MRSFYRISTSNEMDTLPPELVDAIIRWTDTLTLPVLRCVCTQWCALLGGRSEAGAALETKLDRTRPKEYGRVHTCKSHEGCAGRYASRLVDRLRWSILGWMIDCVRAEAKTLQRHACEGAASQGDLDRTLSFLVTDNRWRKGVVQHAAKYGHVHVVDPLLDRWPDIYQDMCRYAARSGDINLVRRFMRKGDRWTVGASCAAAKHGHTAMLEWAVRVDRTLVLDPLVSLHAAKGGRLEVLQWLRRRGCPWHSDVTCYAVMRGDVDVLQWATSNGCPWGDWTCMPTTTDAHLDLLRWAIENGAPMSGSLFCHVARKGCIYMLAWLHERGCPRSAAACADAASAGHIDVLVWLKNHGHPLTASIIHIAIERNHVAVLQWAWENSCPRPPMLSSLCNDAAGRGHLEMLQWLHAKGHRWGARACLQAVRGGHVRVVRWLIENGQEWSSDMCFVAAQESNLYMLQWLRSQGCPWDDRVCHEAALRACLEVLRWALLNGCPWPDDTPTRRCTVQKYPRVGRWARGIDAPL